MVIAYLAFLEKDALVNPGNITTISKGSIHRAVELTENVEVSDNDEIPDDVSI